MFGLGGIEAETWQGSILKITSQKRVWPPHIDDCAVSLAHVIQQSIYFCPIPINTCWSSLTLVSGLERRLGFVDPDYLINVLWVQLRLIREPTVYDWNVLDQKKTTNSLTRSMACSIVLL